jgi:hypothetical protein
MHRRGSMMCSPAERMEHLTSPKTGEEQRVILSGAHGNLSGASAECTYVRCEIHDDKITAYIRRTQLVGFAFICSPWTVVAHPETNGCAAVLLRACVHELGWVVGLKPVAKDRSVSFIAIGVRRVN